MIILAVMAACGGCAFVQPAADKAADAVVKYCTTSTYEARQLYRNTINAQMPPGYSVQVSCAGDPE
jgi:hypothetical protein